MITKPEECGTLLRMYREKETLMGSFFSVKPLVSPYFEVKIEVKNGIAVLKAEDKIASFNGKVLSIEGHLPEEGYVSDVFDAILRDGCERFSGKTGIRAVEMLNARWAEDWYTLCHDFDTVDCQISYPFRMNLLDLKILLPHTFFSDFLGAASDETLQYQQKARHQILTKLHELIHIPENRRERVIRRMFEMKLDEMTS
jgi:hypothetical protein